MPPCWWLGCHAPSQPEQIIERYGFKSRGRQLRRSTGCHCGSGSAENGMSACHELQSSVAIPLLQRRENTPAGPSSHKLSGLPTSSAKSGLQSASRSRPPRYARGGREMRNAASVWLWSSTADGDQDMNIPLPCMDGRQYSRMSRVQAAPRAPEQFKTPPVQPGQGPLPCPALSTQPGGC